MADNTHTTRIHTCFIMSAPCPQCVRPAPEIQPTASPSDVTPCAGTHVPAGLRSKAVSSPLRLSQTKATRRSQTLVHQPACETAGFHARDTAIWEDGYQHGVNWLAFQGSRSVNGGRHTRCAGVEHTTPLPCAGRKFRAPDVQHRVFKVAHVQPVCRMRRSTLHRQRARWGSGTYAAARDMRRR